MGTYVCKSLVLAQVLVAGTAIQWLALAPTAYAQRPDTTVELAERYEVTPAIEFAHVDDRALLLDLYLPKERMDTPLPVVVWIFGGAWKMGSRRGGPAIELTSHGYAVACIDYRFSQDAVFPAQIEDCLAAIRWLRDHAKEYGLNGRVGVWGASSGGHLAALVGTAGGSDQFERQGERGGASTRVQAVCDWFGPTDFLQMDAHSAPGSRLIHDAPDSPESQLIGGPIQENPKLAALANPITYISPDDPPFLILHGDSDPLVPVHQSQLFAGALEAAGVEVTLEILEDSGHGSGAFRRPETFDKVRAFFDQHLKGDEASR